MEKWIVKSMISREANLNKNNLIYKQMLPKDIKRDKIGIGENELLKLNNPFLLKDMDRAVERIDAAIKGRQKVIVFGSYDVDGITSTSILYRALMKLGVDVNYYIPDKTDERKGLSKEAIEYVKSLATDVIITVDCGIASVQEVKYAKGLGMDVIITDHHECSDIIPNTIVINPKRRDCIYPCKDLSGCGVAFKLIQALWNFYGLSGYEDLLDIAAMGTISENVPLVGENRTIVNIGLKNIIRTEKCGIRAIKAVTEIHGRMSMYKTIIQIVNKINAASKISNAKIIVELFTTCDYYKALQIAKYLECENKNRLITDDFDYIIEDVNIDCNLCKCY